METTPPETPSWLDNAFIEKAVRETEDRSDVVVTKLDVRPALSKGENYTSVMLRITAHLDVGDLQEKRHLIMKTLSSAEMMQKFLDRCQVFEKEIRMYQETLPAMNEVLAKQGLHPLSATPYTTSRHRSVLMQDLSYDGFKMATRHSGLDLSHACYALRMLARFHAASLVVLRRDPTSMDAYSSHIYSEANRDLVDTFFEPMIRAIVSQVSQWEGYEHFAQKLSQKLTTDHVIKFMLPRDGETTVLNHGDAWVNNILFKVTDANEVIDMRFVDLQIMQVVCPTVDLQYMFYTSLWPHVLQGRSRELLQVYHEEFANILQLADEKVPEDLSNLDDLENKFNKNRFYGLWAAASVLPIIMADPIDAVDFENWEQDSQKSGRFSSSHYTDTFQKLLRHFEEEGVFDANIV